MITNFNNFVNESLGSSLALPANGLGGSRATSLLVAHFVLKNTATNPAKKKNRPGGGGGEGGFGGNPATPERIQKANSPAVLLVKSRAPQNSFLFLLEEKDRRAQIKKCEENFFAGWRASASGGGAERQISQSGFSSKKVRILSKRYRQNYEVKFYAKQRTKKQI